MHRRSVASTMPLLSVWGMLSAVVFLGAAPAWGYEEKPVVDGGRLTGRVTLVGDVPPPRIFHLVFSPNMDYCGAVSDGAGNRLLREFRVSDDGGFEGVVVAMVGVEHGKPFTHAPRLDIDRCRISPFVMPVQNGGRVSLVNHDPVSHDIQAYSMRKNFAILMFNKPLVGNEHAVKNVKMRKGHYLFHAQCGVHDFMRSWGIAVGNPYFAISGSDGAFVIDDVPPGTYDVIAWHPRMSIQAERVTVRPNDRTVMNLRFDANEVDIPLHDLQEGYRLDTVLDARPIPEPFIERQVP